MKLKKKKWGTENRMSLKEPHVVNLVCFLVRRKKKKKTLAFGSDWGNLDRPLEDSAFFTVLIQWLGRIRALFLGGMCSVFHVIQG